MEGEFYYCRDCRELVSREDHGEHSADHTMTKITITQGWSDKTPLPPPKERTCDTCAGYESCERTEKEYMLYCFTCCPHCHNKYKAKSAPAPTPVLEVIPEGFDEDDARQDREEKEMKQLEQDALGQSDYEDVVKGGYPLEVLLSQPGFTNPKRCVLCKGLIEDREYQFIKTKEGQGFAHVKCLDDERNNEEPVETPSLDLPVERYTEFPKAEPKPKLGQPSKFKVSDLVYYTGPGPNKNMSVCIYAKKWDDKNGGWLYDTSLPGLIVETELQKEYPGPRTNPKDTGDQMGQSVANCKLV